MRRLLILLLALGPIAALFPPAFAQNDPASVPRITIAELKKLQESGAVTLVDVRDAVSFQAGHIPGALSIPPDRVAGSAGRLKAARKPVVLYCA